VSTPEERLTDALRAEHAAIYGYGLVGAHLDAATQPLALAAEAAHRSKRDALVVLLAGRARTPPPAEPAYTSPTPVTDQASALRLAVGIEEATAAVWRLALPDTTGADRKLALDALSDCAVRAARARRAARITPMTVPFPGT
jgi:Domain of unknown function (DUF4439)